MTPYYSKDGIEIYCGDCREILPTLPKVELVLTDPPYGVGLKEHGRHGYDWKIQGDESQTVGQFVLDAAERDKLATIAFSSPMLPWRGKWRQHLVWDKSGAVGGGGDIATCWKFSFEVIQIARTPKLTGKRDEAVLRFPIERNHFKFHPTQKPLSLIKYLLSKASPATVLDPFMGSGTTLVAAKQLGRRCIGIEIEEKYCQIAVERLRQGVLDFT